MKNIKFDHYLDTVIYSVDMIMKNLKIELKQRVDKLKIGITSEQLWVLDAISSYNNIYQEKLSEILMKDKSNITRILKILVNKGLITRDVNKVNNRLVYILNITEEGKSLLRETIPKVKTIIMDIFQNITDDEIEQLHVLSKKFQTDLQKNKIQNT